MSWVINSPVERSLILEARTGHGNDIPRFPRPVFPHFSRAVMVSVVQDIAVGLSHSQQIKTVKVRHKAFPVLAGNLVYGIAAIRAVSLEAAKPSAVRCEQVALAFLGIVIAACGLLSKPQKQRLPPGCSTTPSLASSLFSSSGTSGSVSSVCFTSWMFP